MTDFDPSRELLAAAYERTDCLTMPWTIRNCPRESLAQPVAVALDALDELVSLIIEQDRLEGSGAEFLEHLMRDWAGFNAARAALKARHTQAGTDNG